MRYHHQNLSDGKYPLWRYGRAWWGRLHWWWGFFRPSKLLQVGIRRWGFSIYLRGLMHFGLVLGDTDDFTERGAWEVGWNDGVLWFEHPWCRQDGWSRSDPWWKHRIRLRIVDWLAGRIQCEHTKGKSFDVVVPMPEGCYRAVATPERFVWRRRWYWPTRVRDSVSLDIPGGIPHSGKGENSWDCGDDGLFGCGGDTVEEAIGGAVASVLRARRRYGHDSMGTGKEPVHVVNTQDVKP